MIEVLIAFHAVESRGVGSSFRQDDLTRIWRDIVILASRAANVLLLNRMLPPVAVFVVSVGGSTIRVISCILQAVGTTIGS